MTTRLKHRKRPFLWKCNVYTHGRSLLSAIFKMLCAHCFLGFPPHIALSIFFLFSYFFCSCVHSKKKKQMVLIPLCLIEHRFFHSPPCFVFIFFKIDVSLVFLKVLLSEAELGLFTLKALQRTWKNWSLFAPLYQGVSGVQQCFVEREDAEKALCTLLKNKEILMD